MRLICYLLGRSGEFRRRTVGGRYLENRDYEKILNAMPKTGVYVVREEDRSLLYFNKRVQEISPEARLGVPCRDVWAGSCSCCPLAAIGGRQENRTVSYNDPYGGVVDVTAVRTLWEGGVPAFVITVVPRTDTSGYAYRKILHVDLDRDRCEVLKSDPKGWQPGDGSLSRQMEQFAAGGAIHPEDVARVIAFTRLEHMRSAPAAGQEALTLLYRRRADESYRWNMMEVIPERTGGETRSALLCVKDVHDVLREGLEREGLSVRSQELIRSLGERNFNIYTIDLDTGAADPIRVNGQMQDGLPHLPWDALAEEHIFGLIQEHYREEFTRRFSLEGLRRARAEERKKSEMLCLWRGEDGFRYISVTAYFSRESKGRSYTVLALQDVDEWMRQELAHTKRDMQMAAILKCRYQMMNTVYLDTGLCERIDLTRSAGPESTLTGDYSQYIHTAAERYVHSDDADRFRSMLSLGHLREKAESVRDYDEEICQYRLRGEQVRWIKLHILYSRQAGQVMVNILGQDVTGEKNQEESRRKALEEQSYMITSLSRLFCSTYYIDLEQDTFRAVTQQRQIGAVLGDTVNCTAALQLYANNFIHPDDRDRYLQTMSVRNLRETLRWWQPYVEVEYHKLPEEGGGLVRATAVLAQTGLDDLPKTVVYVARNIAGDSQESGSRRF